MISFFIISVYSSTAAQVPIDVPELSPTLVGGSQTAMRTHHNMRFWPILFTMACTRSQTGNAQHAQLTSPKQDLTQPAFQPQA
jgi:hypothetical protein